MPDRTPSSHPAVDPLDAATAWLSAHSFCDPQCTENHPAPHSMVSAAEAEARTARIAAAEYKRERDEALSTAREAVRLFRSLACGPPASWPVISSEILQIADGLDPERSS